MWDVQTGSELPCQDTGAYDAKIKFSDDGAKLMVNGRLIYIPSRISMTSNTTTSPSSTTITTKSSKLHAEFDVDALGIDGNWVTLDSKRISWLPPEYRPVSWERFGNVAEIGSGARRITFISRWVTG